MYYHMRIIMYITSYENYIYIISLIIEHRKPSKITSKQLIGLQLSVIVTKREKHWILYIQIIPLCLLFLNIKEKKVK